MKTKKATRQSKAQNRPYDSSQRSRHTRVKREVTTTVPSSITTTSASTKPNPGNGAAPFREFALQNVRSRNPGIEPRNDWELLQLSSRSIKGTPAEVYAWLDAKYAREVERDGVEEVEWCVAEMLNTWMEPTGMKPRPGEVSKYVHVRPIPDSKYSIRLFPGSISAAEYCMDFIDSATGEPVNSPFEYELWVVPDPDTPWLGMPMCQQMRSIERIHGIKQEDILPGHEKFILRDGLTCVLNRPGKPGVRFTVPVRKQPDAKPPPEIHVLDFPKVID
ncbi:hypothetical protein PYCCODRAFT_1432596 [Trametes coccinea BRFM310]|uniref:Uncharacterized protein n=1 Tax=Trametes coccinea (strain BRFM310) TaxID=1353009 RepID=A0A1Y2IWF0_TRAC3|nr:hypothetical protein PYCCODRAFT_1432596 [Trametes coccinea BRFM310]